MLKGGAQTKDGGLTYVCKVEINIDPDDEFDVVRRIQGAKNCNFRRIIEFSIKDVQNPYMH